MSTKTRTTKEQISDRVSSAIIPDDQRIRLDEFQTAKLLNCSVHKLRRDRWAGGGIPYLKITDHGTVRYQRSDIDVFLYSRMRTSTSDPGAVIAKKAGKMHV